ncbi:ATP-dependent helicase HrpB [Ketobacter sp. MCCC 1A13808]|uniref:ATP-dependent helicase HrpB n=1 Tax=Ketobacter sp. MCCC 1A13808 TaxID=2602738 RepID=UPI0012EBA017|nr:ATP-dependent helicase HrpB [Ketobacter sp. MCCC 1A13808]MVF12219.1 ATP-dependent helicase HrpB [Ketobacter sp. MCCC 1A13808]
MQTPSPLPIDQVIDPLLQSALMNQTLVVQAPPGAGKTTRIPLVLQDQPWIDGKIILIQPRRLAVLGAASRLAFNLSEPIGERVGLRTRFDNQVGANCKIEVMTDGIFLNQIQNDAELAGVSMVIFDEFHERSVNMDLGLAFALETQAAFRDRNHPLRLLVMSATLNGDHLSQWLEAPLIQSRGRSYEVTTHYRPLPGNLFIEQHITNLIMTSLQHDEGSLLVFLPGMKQIRIVQQQLEARLTADNIDICPLHASLSAQQQQRAIQPDAPGRRKIVLATNVAETSVTIDGIRVVIDSGLVRAAHYDERRGMDNLMTVPISAASAEQRRGRAGRTQPGVCYRVWSETEHQSKKPYTDAEIAVSDLAPVALQLAAWGNSDAKDLKLLDPPDAQQLQRAQEFLAQLGILNNNSTGANKTLTNLGTQVARLGLPPRIGCLVWQHRHSELKNATVNCAAILSEGDPLRLERDQQQADILLRLDALAADSRAAHATRQGSNKGTFRRLHALQRQLLNRLRHSPGDKDSATIKSSELAAALAHSFPDRIAQQRQPNSSRYLMSNGKGVQLTPQDPLRQHPYLVVMDCDGPSREPTIRLACAISLNTLTQALNDQIETEPVVYWDYEKKAVVAETQTRLGALALKQTPLSQPWPEAAQQIMLNVILENDLNDLPWSDDALRLLSRLRWLQQHNPAATGGWHDFSAQGLKDSAESWLRPFLTSVYRIAELKSFPLLSALNCLLNHEQKKLLDLQAPEFWTLPTGNSKKVDYPAGKAPVIRARMTEFYGLSQHPTLADGTAITLELLSPAQRPLQITQDIVGFWQGSYQAVAKEMRGRYPKHFWPEDPLTAAPTARTKKGMTRNDENT